ncbi:MAG: NAD(P)H-quinone oxidoreductase [Sphingomonadaceae bacterium]
MASLTLPATMPAILIDRPGGPEALVLREVPLPVPGPGEVLIRVEAAGVNRPDIIQREGRYPVPPGAPAGPGLEAAGEVVALGPGTGRWRISDRVTALLNGGGYAGFAVAPEGQCLPVPSGLSALEAAALPETVMTVWRNLFELGRARAGEWALVHGGTSGIGVAAIQLARAMGVRVAVTCGSPAKCDAARGLGADLAIDYRAEDFVAAVRAAKGGRGVDVVLDMVGGDYLPRNLAALAPGGRHVSIAFQRGREAPLDLALVMGRGLVLAGSLLRPQPPAVKAALARAVEREVWPLVASGAVRAVIDRVFPLAEAAEAHRRMEAGEHVGKIMLAVAS